MSLYLCFFYQRKLQEQDELLREMDELVTRFDKKLEKVHLEQLEHSVSIKILEIFLLSLHQELAVIKSYEKLENDLSLRITTMTFIKYIRLLQVNKHFFSLV